MQRTGVALGDYRREYNAFRPHSKPGYLIPERFAARKSASSPLGLRPPSAGDGQPNNNLLETKTLPQRLNSHVVQLPKSRQVDSAQERSHRTRMAEISVKTAHSTGCRFAARRLMIFP